MEVPKVIELEWALSRLRRAAEDRVFGPHEPIMITIKIQETEVTLEENFEAARDLELLLINQIKLY